jgi:quercetin dioxygenase-like cupin family protein
MQKFCAGLFVGILVSTAMVAAERRASERIVRPRVLVENSKVRMVRWVLKPGEGTPIHEHALDHISVVIHGSKMRFVTEDGTTTENVQPTGNAVYVLGTGLKHSFANIGNSVFESVSIELKNPSAPQSEKLRPGI